LVGVGPETSPKRTVAKATAAAKAPNRATSSKRPKPARVGSGDGEGAGGSDGLERGEGVTNLAHALEGVGELRVGGEGGVDGVAILGGEVAVEVLGELEVATICLGGRGVLVTPSGDPSEHVVHRLTSERSGTVSSSPD